MVVEAVATAPRSTRPVFSRVLSRSDTLQLRVQRPLINARPRRSSFGVFLTSRDGAEAGRGADGPTGLGTGPTGSEHGAGVGQATFMPSGQHFGGGGELQLAVTATHGCHAMPDRPLASAILRCAPLSRSSARSSRLKPYAAGSLCA